jgi:serine/threonine-protein kinase
MAEVHRGYHANLDRYVAIKVLHAFLADDPEFKNRFLKEAQNVARLKHPHIVQVYDFDFDPEGESYYMVMELIEGPTLKDRMSLLHNDGDLLDFKEIVRIVREAASALAYAHSRDMIHRDVKPANLMLDHDDRVVLTDFGIAKIVTGAQFTASGGMVGTPAYMAPEQGLGEAGDERSDLYSLGIIFYQLLTGTLPYDAEAPLAIILKHLNSPIPLVSETNPNYPPSVDDVVARMMAKEPEERYQSANDLIVDLDRLMDDEPVPSRAIAAIAPPDTEADLDTERADQPLMPAAGGQGGRPPRRRVPMWLVGGLLSVLLLGGGYLALLGGGVLPPGLAGVASPTTTETPTTTPTITLTATATMTATEAPSETPTATITPTITPTPSDTPTETHTPTHTASPTATDTATLTHTPTATITATPTASHTPTATITPTPSITLTPSPDLTQTLIQATLVLQIQTATIAACDFDYAVVEQVPPDGEFYRSNSDYVREIRLLNTGNCPWERNTSLVFVDGEDFDAQRIWIRERVNPGDEVTLTFMGRTPPTGGVRAGTWELRTPGQILIGEPLVISISVFEG